MTAIKENKMGVDPIGRLLLGMSLPSIFSMFIQAMYNILDSVFVAQLGEDALTAVSLAFPVQTLMIAMAVGTGVGVNSIISRRLGEKNLEEANLSASHGILLAVIIWVIFAVAGAFFSQGFMAMFTDSPQVLRMGTDYVRIVTIGSLGVFVQLIIARIFQSTGDMVRPMVIQFIGALFNAILDPIMIFGLLGFPAMGVRGGAYSTVIGQVFSMVLCIILLWRSKLDVKVTFRRFKFHWYIVRNIYSVGFPSILMQAIAAFLTMGLNGILIGFSQAAVSVLGVYYKLNSFVFMPVFGLMQGSLPIMGYNFGAKNRERLMRCFHLTTIASCAIMTAGMLVFMVWPHQLLRLFKASEDMLSIGVPALRIIGLCFPLAGVGIAISTMFQSIGSGIRSLIVSVLRQVVVILPVAWIFARLLGLNAVWFAFPLAELVAMVASLWMYRHTRRNELVTMQVRSEPEFILETE